MLDLVKHSSDSIGLIGHTVVNYPSPEAAREIIKILVTAGVSCIELQIPFSEPVADGPAFVKANEEALKHHVDVAQCFEFMHEMTQLYDIPFVFMTYANILFRKGYDEFVSQAKKAGAQGAIVPDLPIENATDYLAACHKHDFAAIQVIPPNVSEQRLAEIAPESQGFVYAVARSGVTGDKTEFGDEVKTFAQQICQHTDLPVAVGFGVSTAEDVEFLKPIADYAIVGTQTLRTYEKQGADGLRVLWESLLQTK